MVHVHLDELRGVGQEHEAHDPERAGTVLGDDEVIPQAPSGGDSSADEIKKYKELLDMGVITQEEFDAKKKQLLGL